MNLNKFFPLDTRTYKPDGSRWPEYCGIEFELENCVQLDGFGSWVPHADGSLRDGVEFVLHPPQGGAKLMSALDEFYARDLKYTAGPRTSTHLHLNMSDSTLDVLRSMIILMYTVEDALFNVVGETRKWAGYAMPLSEMDANRLRLILTATDDALLRNNIAPNRNQERYYGFNVSSVRKHGTVEFRYFPGGPTKAEMISWLDFICAVKKAATNYPPATLIDMINNEGDLVTLLNNTFGATWAGALMAAVPINNMFEKFSEVASLATVGDQLERRERLVFLTKPLVKFINTNLLQAAGRVELAKVVEVFPVVSEGDFIHYMSKAYTADFVAKKKGKDLAQEEYDDEDEDNVAQPAGEVPPRFIRWEDVIPMDPDPAPARLQPRVWGEEGVVQYGGGLAAPAEPDPIPAAYVAREQDAQMARAVDQLMQQQEEERRLRRIRQVEQDRLAIRAAVNQPRGRNPLNRNR